MIPWIQVYSNITTHPKTSKLADELNLQSAQVNPNIIAAGMMVSLWTWAIQNAYSGDLKDCSARTIAEACKWKKKPETFVQALITAGYLDEDMKLHDWLEYTYLWVESEQEKKENAKERVRRHRAKKNKECNADVTVTCNADVTQNDVTCNVTETRCNAPTPPDITIPYISGGDGDTPQRACEAVDNYCRERATDPRECLGYTEELADRVRDLTDTVFRLYAERKPTKADADKVYLAVCVTENDAGEWTASIDTDKSELLIYAFEAAANASKPGNWNYVNGVLDKLRQRGITTLSEAEQYDAERDMEKCYV